MITKQEYEFFKFMLKHASTLKKEEERMKKLIKEYEEGVEKKCISH